MYIVVGLGNPGKEYEYTRHNAGKMAVDFLSDKVSDIKVVETKTFMNLSGGAVAKFVKGEEEAKRLVVLYDDIDLPLGSIKVSCGRGSGGHRGVESIIKALGTKEFIRIRIGIVPTNIFGKMKKPKGEGDVEKFILGEFKKSEKEVMEKVFERCVGAIETLQREGLAKAMTKFNR